MRGRVALADRVVIAGRDDLAVERHDRANRHLAELSRLLRLGQRKTAWKSSSDKRVIAPPAFLGGVRVVAVISTPPSMRAISSTRCAESSTAI